MNKKHLRALYEEQKPPMGVFRLVDSSTAQEYLGVNSNIQATKNSLFSDFLLVLWQTIHHYRIAMTSMGLPFWSFPFWKSWIIKRIFLIIEQTFKTCSP
nr:hypothetical protein [uncultured Sphaerochaeta sp.]